MSDQIFVNNEMNTNVAAESMLNASDDWQERQSILREMAEEEIARENGFWFYMECCGFNFDEAKQIEVETTQQQIMQLQEHLNNLLKIQ